LVEQKVFLASLVKTFESIRMAHGSVMVGKKKSFMNIPDLELLIVNFWKVMYRFSHF